MVTGLSAGNFDGLGQLKINLALNSYTFNLNGLAGYPSGGHVGIFLNGVNEPSFVSGNNPGGEVRAESIKLGTNNDPEVTFLTFNPSASNMVLGQTYTLEIEYNLALNTASNLFGGGAGELDLGLFTYRTQLTLIAVPEPSTYAAIFGGVALAGVMLHRRRRASA
ncbi:MAG: PEP-CTERM sorting domain-containing protein [Opitutae bacterium]|nr:PEP-CTERM sorting domain-containing protein [Opitutae bacterium]